MARRKREKARARPRGKAAPKCVPKAPTKKDPKGTRCPPKKAAPKPRQKAAAAPRKAPTKKTTTSPKPRQKAAQRARQKHQRDYKKEYQRRIARAEVIQRAAGRVPSKAVGRGHPRAAKGEIGLAEIRQLRRAAELPSVGQQRERGETKPVHYELRDTARARIAEIAGVPAALPESTGRARRSAAAQKFAETFVALGLGTLHDAYTLYFSP